MINIVDRLLDEIDKKQNPSCIGLDPRIGDIPNFVRDASVQIYGNNVEAVTDAMHFFCKRIIDATHDIVPAYKPNAAFFEKYGLLGVASLQKTIDYIKEKGCIAKKDAKRNDIGPTAEAYADGILGEVELCKTDDSNPEGKVSLDKTDMVTVNPYLGIDGVKPFIDVSQKYGKGTYILVKTSNKSSADIQDKFVELEPWQRDVVSQRLEGTGIEITSLPQFKERKDKVEEWATGKGYVPNFVGVATLVDKWGKDSVGERGFSNVGAVIGVTFPEEARVLRKLMPHTFALGPGFGKQGAAIKNITALFNENGEGGIINNSRGAIFAYKEEPYKQRFGEQEFENATRAAAEDMRDAIVAALKEEKKCRW